MKKIAILGNGQLGRAMKESIKEALILTKKDIDFSLGYSIKPLLKKYLSPYEISVIINCIAYTNVDKAQTDKEICYAINEGAVKALAEYSADYAIPFIHFSTDFVFDGFKEGAYEETDEPNPLNIYGASKLAGEKAIGGTNSNAFIFRLAWVYSAYFENNFIAKIIKSLIARQEITVVDDQVGNLCNTADVAEIIKTILPAIISRENDSHKSSCIYHLSPARPYLSRYAIACLILKTINAYFNQPLVGRIIKKADTSSFPLAIKRPLNSMLNNKKFSQAFKIALPDWTKSCQTEIIKMYTLLKS